MKIIQEKRIFLIYEFGLLFKVIQASLEIIGGVLLYTISTNTITTLVLAFTHEELLETPKDFLSHLLLNGVNLLSTSGKFFVAFYLLSHGVIKIIIITGLFLKKKWSLPVAIIGFSVLILYELYILAVNYSLSLFIFTIMDIIILWLVIREHNVPKRYTQL